MIRSRTIWLIAVATVQCLSACTAISTQGTPPAGQAASVERAVAMPTADDASAPAAEVAEGIQWRAWEPATFALAQAADKLILLDLTAVWCHWCHVMDTTTYADPTVIELVNDSYVAIRVDTDQRPDVTARYMAGGWPTTAILTPDGATIVAATYVPPENMVHLLQQVNGFWAEDRDQITAHVLELQKERVVHEIEPATGVPTNTVESSLGGLAANYDAENGGFGWEPKFLDPSSIELILRTNHAANDPAWWERVNHTLTGLTRLVDPVWGGVYRYSVTADWQTPHFEKMLDSNAQALRTVLSAYQATDTRSYRESAEAILRYVERFLSDPAGGFYSSQDADLYRTDGGEILMEGEEYYALTEEERIAAGIPHVDQAIYAGSNGQMITALLQAATVLEQPRYQELALKALDRLWGEGRGRQGQMLHSLNPGRDPDQANAANTGSLNDQTHMGTALLAAYSVTGRHDYLAHAEELAHYVLDDLRNAATGAFYDMPFDPTAVGELAVRQSPCEENVDAARFFTRLHRHTDLTDYRAAAEGALKFCTTMTGDYPSYALAVDDLQTYPLTLAVVGTQGQAKTDALLAAADRFYWPGKVVTPLDPTLGPPTLGELTYPPDRVAIYACSEGLCSAPVEDPQELAEQVAWLVGANQE